MIGGNYNKWIVILQEFDPKFVLVKLKNSLIFVELLSNFPSLDKGEVHEDSFVDEHIFLISNMDPWYEDIIVYFQTLKVPSHFSRDERRPLLHVAKNYLIFMTLCIIVGLIPFCVDV